MSSRHARIDPGLVRWPTDRARFYGDKGMTVYAVVLDLDNRYPADGDIAIIVQDTHPAPWMAKVHATLMNETTARSFPTPKDFPDLLAEQGVSAIAAVFLGATPAKPWWREVWRTPGHRPTPWAATLDDLTRAGRAIVDSLTPLGTVHLITAIDT